MDSTCTSEGDPLAWHNDSVTESSDSAQLSAETSGPPRRFTKPALFRLPRCQISLRTLLELMLAAGLWCGYFLLPSPTERQWTNRELDIAISGRGYLTVIDTETTETVYTTYGHLVTDSNYSLAIQGQSKVWHIDPPIMILCDATAVHFEPTGKVYIEQSEQNTRSIVGQLQLALFAAPQELIEVEPGFYKASRTSGRATITVPEQKGAGSIAQRWLVKLDSQWKLREYLPAFVVTSVFLLMVWEIRRLQRGVRELTQLLKQGS